MQTVEMGALSAIRNSEDFKKLSNPDSSRMALQGEVSSARGIRDSQRKKEASLSQIEEIEAELNEHNR